MNFVNKNQEITGLMEAGALIKISTCEPGLIYCIVFIL